MIAAGLRTPTKNGLLIIIGSACGRAGPGITGVLLPNSATALVPAVERRGPALAAP